MATTTKLPALSDELKDEAFSLGGSSVVNLWKHGQRLEKRDNVVGDSPSKPGTIVASSSLRMMNLVPQDSSHPLYHNKPNYAKMRRDFLHDSMILENVSPTDPKMKESDGLSVTNMNGRAMVFKQKPNGELYVNDLLVEKQKEVSDGTMLYVVDGVIFTYETDIKQAWKKLLEDEPEQECFNEMSLI